MRLACILILATPSYIAALAWAILLGPRSGLVNNIYSYLTGAAHGPFNAYSKWGVIFVVGIYMFPLMFLPLAAALEKMDSSLEDAAASLGVTRWTVFRTVTLPLMTPAVISGAILVLVESFLIYGPVGLLGNPIGFNTLPIAILQLLQYPPRIQTAAVICLPILLILFALLGLRRIMLGQRRFTTLQGKPGRRWVAELRLPGKIAAVGFLFAVIFITLVLPYGIIGLTSIRAALGAPLTLNNLTLTANYKTLFGVPDFIKSIEYSVLLAAGGAFLGLAFGLLSAWLVERKRSRIASIVALVSLIPLAMAGSVLGIALVISYAGKPFLLEGTYTILLIAYVIRAIPYSFLYMSAGLKQIGPELEEASRALGGSPYRTLVHVTLPLLLSSIVSVGLLNFILLSRDLEASVFLYGGANPVVAVVLFNLAGEAQFGPACAFATIIIALNAVGLIVARRGLNIGFANS